MTLATTLLASALVVSTMPPPEYDDCEVVTRGYFEKSPNFSKPPFLAGLVLVF